MIYAARRNQHDNNVPINNELSLSEKTLIYMCTKFKSEKGILIAAKVASTADGISKITENSILEMSLAGSGNETIHTHAKGIRIHAHAEGIS